MTKPPPDEDAQNRIVAVTLDEESIGRSGPDIEHERPIAIYDLIEQNLFAPEAAGRGPLSPHLGSTRSRVRGDNRRGGGAPPGAHLWCPSPLRAAPVNHIMDATA